MTLLHAGGLLLLSLLLLMLEIFIPSAGLLGLAAAAALIAAIIIGFMHSATTGGAILVVTAFLVPLVVSLSLRIWPRTPLGRRILNVVDPDEAAIRQQDQDSLRHQWVGKVGVARMDLLPNGVIDVAGARLDAVSLAGVIDRGANVEIVNVVAGKFQVRRTERPPDPVDRSEHPAAFDDQVADSLETPIEAFGIDDLDEPLR